MTTEEFSNEIDLFTNAYLPSGFILDEYEKSVLLTKAQEAVVVQLYGSFEKREISKELLSPLIKTVVINDEFIGEDANGNIITELFPISDCSYFYKLPDDLWLITFEEVVIGSKDKCLNNKRLSVVPTTQDKLSKILKNPFKGANDNRALRLNIADNVVEIISKHEVKRYYVRYIKKLTPIILTDLTDSTSIAGLNKRTECMLHESIHKDILATAIDMAKQMKYAIYSALNEQQQDNRQTEQNQ